MKKSLLWISLTILFFASCTYDESWKNIPVNDHFSVDIPPYVKKVNDLRPGAPLQYSNKFRNFYIIGLEYDLNKNISLDSLQRQLIKPIITYVTHPIITDSLPVNINGLPARENKITGELESGDGTEIVYYRHLSIIGKKRMYELCTWTRGPKRIEQHDTTFTRILYSFKEL